MNNVSRRVITARRIYHREPTGLCINIPEQQRACALLLSQAGLWFSTLDGKTGKATRMNLTAYGWQAARHVMRYYLKGGTVT